MTAKYVEGDHGTIIRRHIKDQAGTPVDITGALDVTLRWLQNTLQERLMTITDAPNGVVEYVIQATDFFAATPGVSFELEYTDAIGNRYTTPVLDGPYEIRRQIGASTALTAAQRVAASRTAQQQARVAPQLGRPARPTVSAQQPPVQPPPPPPPVDIT